MGKLVVAAVLWTLVAVGNGRSEELAPAPPAPVQIQQPLRCVAQLCLPIPAQVSMKAADWQVSMKAATWNSKFSANAVTQPLQPLPVPGAHGGLSFNFPPPKSSHRLQFVYYETTTASPLLIQGWYVKVSGRASRGRASHLPTDMTCWVYFQEVGDDLSGQGQHAYYRWRSTKPLIPSANDNFVQFVGLEPEFWSTVTGELEKGNFVKTERGDASAAATAGFQRALGNAQSIGIICGTYVSGDLYAGDSIPDPYTDNRMLQLTLDSFAVCDPLAPSAKQENETCAPPRVP